MDNHYNENQPINVYEKNKAINKEKISFAEFWHYSSMAELYIDEFHQNLFWNGIIECFLFILCLGLAISYFSKLGWLLFFIVHVARGLIGFFCIYYIPKTHGIIDEIKGFENSTIKDIQKNVIDLFKQMLQVCQNKIRPLLFAYLIMTFVTIIVDFIMFIALLASWGKTVYSFNNIITLYLICIFFGKNMLMYLNYASL